MNYVVDCSFSSALFLPDEQSDTAQKFFLDWKKGTKVYVPALWWYETQNVLNVALKRERLTYVQVLKIIDLLHTLHIQVDGSFQNSYSKQTIELSQLYNLSAYDAAYLELAIRKKAKLMTTDKVLRVVAGKAGVLN